MFFFFSASGQRLVVRSTLLLRQGLPVRGPAIYSGLPRGALLDYARASNGWVYLTSGLGPMLKWDGQTTSVIQAGVPAPTTALTMAISGGGTLFGIYRAYQRWVDAYGNVSNLSPVSVDVAVENKGTVYYTHVEAPSDPRVASRQILRNVAGSLLVFYIDIETNDLGSTEFTSTKTDSELRNEIAVPLFDESLSVDLANRYGEPPNHKPFIAYFFNRLWAYGELAYTDGHVSVVQGSDQVTGTGTQFPEAFVNRFLYVRGADRAYEITAVDVSKQTLTLAEPYATSAIPFAAYSVRPAPALRQLLYYSESTVFDGWPAAQAIQVDNSDDMNDEGTGLMATQSFLYVMQRRHVHRMSYLLNPATDGGIFLACRRGCVNNRCFAAVDGFVYMLDDRGIYRFDGSDKAEDLSQAIQDVFYFDQRPGKLRINWNADKYFFCSHDRDHNILRWHVALSGSYLPRHALCFNYSQPQWWIEEYPFPLGDGELLPIVRASSIVVGPAGKAYAMNVGHLDIVSGDRGDTLLSALSATHRTVTMEPGTVLPSSGVVGAPLSVVSGRGKRQTRLVTASSGRTLTLNRPWHVRPDATSILQLGGIPWQWKSGWSGWMETPFQQVRNVVLNFQPTQVPVTLDVRIYEHYSEEPTAWAVDWPRNASESSGVIVTQDDPNAVVQLDRVCSGIYVALDNWGRVDEYGPDNMAVEMRGYSCQEKIALYQLELQGAEE